MSDYATPLPRFAKYSDRALPLWLVEADADIPADANAADWAEATGFSGAEGQLCLLQGEKGELRGALYGIGNKEKASRSRFAASAVASKLPEAIWKIVEFPDWVDAEEIALGWLLSAYKFSRYAGNSGPQKAQLSCPDSVNATHVEAFAAGEFLTRDLINTPASDMGPDALERAARALADEVGATMTVTTGDALLDDNFPLIHAVGRAAAQEPRLIDMRIGDSGPLLTLVGKGVCFDTGGLNLKPGASMGLMKKDMGGSATVLGLTRMLARTGALERRRLRVLIPAVENSVSASSFRPGDILQSRAGHSVEINNTDAEGRLVLADALALGGEEKPELMISMATLTGAARVALGHDIPPFYCDNNEIADAIGKASMRIADPVWRMPFWDPYESNIEPGIADLDNAPAGGMAGSIIAALFLRRFAGGAKDYAHFDIFGWNPVAAPARTKGGVGQGARAVLAALDEVL